MILITGGTGTSGVPIVQALLDRGISRVSTFRKQSELAA